ncbi:MAG: NAD(P)-dependent oxidoreductase [Rhodobacteraceae bacterium]|jgi:nucleoside-diphosphate-sugar epimerase|nr:NAD(P)-dependent oxidoreductase [Paracoccaceae bacterium]
MSLVLVTGGAGMVGQHVAEAAAARGLAVRLAERSWEGRAHWAPAAERIAFDVRDGAACRTAAAGVRAVIHCAAVVGPAAARADAAAALAVNVTGTANMLEAAHAAGARLVALSTATLYGHRPDLAPLEEDAPPDPLGLYDATKLMAEVWCTAHRRAFGSSVASVRTGFVFGRGTAIGEYFLPRVLRGEAVRLAAGADHPCDFTYVVDLAEALVAAALAAELPATVYNVTGGRLRRRADLAAAVQAVVPAAEISEGPGTDPARHLRGPCVIARAARDFGWAPRFTLETGIADWHRRVTGAGP